MSHSYQLLPHTSLPRIDVIECAAVRSVGNHAPEIQGPEDTPYERGTFLLDLQIPDRCALTAVIDHCHLQFALETVPASVCAFGVCLWVGTTYRYMSVGCVAVQKCLYQVRGVCMML